MLDKDLNWLAYIVMHLSLGLGLDLGLGLGFGLDLDLGLGLVQVCNFHCIGFPVI